MPIVSIKTVNVYNPEGKDIIRFLEKKMTFDTNYAHPLNPTKMSRVIWLRFVFLV